MAWEICKVMSLEKFINMVGLLRRYGYPYSHAFLQALNVAFLTAAPPFLVLGTRKYM